MWHVEVITDSKPYDQLNNVFVVDKPFLVAKWASLANPGKDVQVSAMARIRAVYRDGKVAKEQPDLTHFYSGVSAMEVRAWKEGTTLPKDE